MEPSVTQPAPPVSEIDDWDNDGFVIPSLAVRESDHDSWDAPGLTDQKPPPKLKIKETESIYLGPHGAPPPSQAKIKELSTSSKNKPKETVITDRKFKSTNRRDLNSIRNHGKEFTKRQT